MRRNKKRVILFATIAVILLISFGWRLPVLIQIESLELPDECKTVHWTWVQLSDVYWLHIKGEKIIKCDLGYEATRAYIETHNSKRKLADIRILPYGAPDDIAIYDGEFDENFQRQPDTDSYIKISYFRKLSK